MPRAAGAALVGWLGMRRARSSPPRARIWSPGIYLVARPRLRSTPVTALSTVSGAPIALQFTYSSVQWLCEHVGNEIRAVMCVALHYSAVQRDAVSRGVVSACRLRCLDRSAVDTGTEFESPSGAPPGYDCGSPIGEVLPWPAEPRAPVEGFAHSGERVARRAARVSVAHTTSARAQPLVGPCVPCAGSLAPILGAVVVSAPSCVRWYVAGSARWSHRRARFRDARSHIGVCPGYGARPSRRYGCAVACMDLLYRMLGLLPRVYAWGQWLAAWDCLWGMTSRSKHHLSAKNVVNTQCAGSPTSRRQGVRWVGLLRSSVCGPPE